MTAKKRRGIVVSFLLAVLYPLSLGPASWWALAAPTDFKRRAVSSAYRPVLWVARQNRTIKGLTCWYMGVGLPRDYSAGFDDGGIFRWNTTEAI